MANMKMVLDGLECEEYSKCGKCPYVKFGKCKTLLIRDIRELLKEQQPMLIDVNQMKQLDDGTDIWMEGKDGEIYALTLKRPWIGFYFDRVENGTYRCWTARPTDEQRKSVPWANT